MGVITRIPWRRYAIAAAAGAVAVGIQWAIIPLVGVRIPFMFILVAVGAVAFYQGLGPAFLVLVIGGANAPGQFEPFGVWAIASNYDRLALAIYVVAGVISAGIGTKMRATHLAARRSLEDIRELHDLGVRLASSTDLDSQLRLILFKLRELLSADKGLLSFYDAPDSCLRVGASFGFSPEGLKQLETVRAGEGVCGTACLEGRRVIVHDTDVDPIFTPFRSLAQQEGFRSAHGTPFFDGEGKVAGVVTFYFENPHSPGDRERHLTEICARSIGAHLDRARAERQVRDRELHLQRVVDVSPVPFAIMAPVRDASGPVIDFSWVYVNRSGANALRHRREDLIGRRVSQVLPGSWDEPGMFASYVATLQDKVVKDFEIHSTENGIEGWFRVVAYELEGKLAIWFVDISQRKVQELELRTADRLKDEFLATLAHELRNPLAPIRQAALVLRRPGASPSQKQWCNEVIERQVAHMSLLLDDLLDVSRITRGVLQLRKQPTRLQPLIDTAIETARPLIQRKQHQLQVKVDQGDEEIEVDPVRTAQIVSNLLNNAAKYTPHGGEITLTAGVTDGNLNLCVTDNGIGMHEADLQMIFRMFSQVRSAEEFAEGGLGIGLALTRGLVELHGGKITAESAGPGMGSTFKVCLPNVVLANDANALEQLQTVAPAASRCILVADDNRDAADSLAMLLRADGHRVVTANDGEMAVRCFTEHRPDVALLDIGMPRLDGHEVARRIRALSSGSDAVLIAITGWGQASDLANSVEAGFDHHLTKPVDYDLLCSLLSSRQGPGKAGRSRHAVSSPAAGAPDANDRRTGSADRRRPGDR